MEQLKLLSSCFSFLYLLLVLEISPGYVSRSFASSVSVANFRSAGDVNTIRSHTIFKQNHPAITTLSKKLYNAALESLTTYPSNLTSAIAYLERSFALLPNSEAAEGLGDIFSSQGNYVDSMEWYFEAFRKRSTDVGLALKLGFDYHKNAQYQTAIKVFQHGIQVQLRNLNGRLNDEDYNTAVMTGLYYHIGLSYFHYGDQFTAAEYFTNSIGYYEDNINARINLAAIFQRIGEIDSSVEHYDYVIRSVHKSFDPFVNLIDNSYIMCASNKIMAFYQVSNFNMAWKAFDEVFFLVSFHFSICKGYEIDSSILGNKYVNLALSPSYCENIVENYYQLISHSLVVSIASVNWKKLEHHSMLLLQKFRVDHNTILPFDSLLYQYNLQDRYRIAIEYSNRQVNYKINENVYYYTAKDLEASLSDINSDPRLGRIKPVLRIGLISNDFSDHPTTHLIEGLLVVKNQSGNEDGNNVEKVLNQVKINLYSYGNNDGSVYRQKMEVLADKFVDLEQNSFDKIARIIHDDRIHILLDMQVHTLGSRIKVLAKQPAFLQVNYLVYPGTSGAPFLSAIVVDRVVAPPEHASFYSESLLMLPPSYQLSWYDRHINSENVDFSINGNYLDDSRGRTILNKIILQAQSVDSIVDALENIPDDSILFCNFNKIDKFEPTTIHIWMNLLVQFPSSYLFLLAPLSIVDKRKTNVKYGNFNTFESVQGSLSKLASYHGVKPSRIIFVRKASKTEHIQRHSVMDIFLDSFGYGAHSTATDALRNGAPLFTLEGGAFPARVASSLIESFTSGTSSFVDGSDSGDSVIRSLLIHHSCKDFEDYVARICKFRREKSRNVLLSIIRRQIISKIDRKLGVFDTRTNAKKLIYGLEGLLESKLVNADEENINKFYNFNKMSKSYPTYFNESSVNGFHIVVK